MTANIVCKWVNEQGMSVKGLGKHDVHSQLRQAAASASRRREAAASASRRREAAASASRRREAETCLIYQNRYLIVDSQIEHLGEIKPLVIKYGCLAAVGPAPSLEQSIPVHLVVCTFGRGTSCMLSGSGEGRRQREQITVCTEAHVHVSKQQIDTQ